jgi:diguanylate cyclase (GGDEF)-like protein
MSKPVILCVDDKKMVLSSLKNQLMLTGQATAEAIGDAVNRAGLFRYIGKPWQENDFLLTIRTALDSYFQTQQTARRSRYRHLLDKVIALALLPEPLQQQLDDALLSLLSIPELKRGQAAIYLVNASQSQLTLKIQQGHAVHFSRHLELPDPVDAEGTLTNTESNFEYRIPLFYQSKLMGILRVSAPSNPSAQKELPQLLNPLANALASVIQLKQYHAALEAHNAELETTVKTRTQDLSQALLQQAKLNDILLDANQKLEFYASMDDLTGLYNRRFFIKLANSEIERARRYSHPTTFMMLDLDYFKDINDQYGHIAGDHVLERVADILKSASRDADLIGRLGGEEFAIVSPESTLEQASQLAERIRKKIHETQFGVGDCHFQLTVSIGITEVLSSDTQVDHAMSRADKALYESKSIGRNKVSIAQTG